MSGSVLADLCREAEWISRRIHALRRSSKPCINQQLIHRFNSEIESHTRRCHELLSIVTVMEDAMDCDSLQIHFLHTLVARVLMQVGEPGLLVVD